MYEIRIDPAGCDWLDRDKINRILNKLRGLGYDTIRDTRDSWRHLCYDGKKWFATDVEVLAEVILTDSNYLDYLTKGDKVNRVKQKAEELYTKIKPYENYILILALLFLIDYYLLDSKYSTKLNKVVTNMFDKGLGVVNKGLDKLGGSDEKA